MRLRIIPLAGAQTNPFIPAGAFSGDDVVTGTIYRTSVNPNPTNSVWSQTLEKGVTAIAVFPEVAPPTRSWSTGTESLEIMWTSVNNPAFLTRQGGITTPSQGKGVPIHETWQGPILIDLLPKEKQFRESNGPIPQITIYVAQII